MMTPALDDYLASINQKLLAINPGLRPYSREDIQGTALQLKVMIDLCHVHGIAVLFNVVYNHAGGDFSDNSIYFFDRKPYGNQNDNQPLMLVVLWFLWHHPRSVLLGFDLVLK